MSHEIRLHSDDVGGNNRMTTRKVAGVHEGKKKKKHNKKTISGVYTWTAQSSLSSSPNTHLCSFFHTLRTFKEVEKERKSAPQIDSSYISSTTAASITHRRVRRLESASGTVTWRRAAEERRRGEDGARWDAADGPPAPSSPSSSASSFFLLLCTLLPLSHCCVCVEGLKPGTGTALIPCAPASPPHHQRPLSLLPHFS